MNETESSAMSDTENMCPGPVPDGETPAPENPAFVSACISVISSDAAATGWHLGNSILTHNDVWGFVFRIDIQPEPRTENSERVSRFVCWSAEEDDTVAGTAVYSARKIKPL
jgi:hypothetical protein